MEVVDPPAGIDPRARGVLEDVENADLSPLFGRRRPRASPCSRTHRRYPPLIRALGGAEMLEEQPLLLTDLEYETHKEQDKARDRANGIASEGGTGQREQ